MQDVHCTNPELVLDDTTNCVPTSLRKVSRDPDFRLGRNVGAIPHSGGDENILLVTKNSTMFVLVMNQILPEMLVVGKEKDRGRSRLQLTVKGNTW